MKVGLPVLPQGGAVTTQAVDSSFGNYVPVNKGHFDLDTAERSAEFYRKLAGGWEVDYARYRRLWQELPARGEVRDYPLLVDLELSSRCNLKCPMCYTTTDTFAASVERRTLDFDLYRRIIDEIAGKVFAVRLSLRGEATLHKHFVEAIAYAKERGIQEVSTLTHGQRLTGDFLRAVVGAGIDWITVSVDGVGESYNRIRKPLTWQGTLARLREISELKRALGQDKPVIKVQGVWPAIREAPQAYYEALRPYTDLIAYNPLIDYLRNDRDIQYVPDFRCPQLYQRLVIASDGRALLCANDEHSEHVIGNAVEESVHAIWHGQAINAVRRQHAKPDGFKSVALCRHCYYPRATTTDETAVVDGRTVVVENYVNRAQAVGE